MFHHVNHVKDPSIVAEGLASAMALVDHGPDHCCDLEHDLCFIFQQPSVQEVALSSEKLFLGELFAQHLLWFDIQRNMT